jgi:hypothetical protein
MELESGRTKDRSRLDTVVIGVLARREIAFLDSEAAKLLEEVADEARKMEAATPQASPIFERKEPAHLAVTSTPTLAPADVLDEAATSLLAPLPAAAPAARSARLFAPAAPAEAASFLAGDLALVATLSGAGDAHLGGPFEGEIGASDVTVRPGGRVEGVITGGRIEVLGRVRGGLVADQAPARINAEVADGRQSPLKSAYLQCRMYCRTCLVLLLRMEGYDDTQARSIIDNHPSRRLRTTDDDLAFEQRKAQRLAEKKAHKPLKRA